MEIKVIEAKDFSEWDNFVENSNQDNIFSKSIFFKNWFKKFKLFYIKKKNEIVMGVLIPEQNYNRENLKSYSYQSIIINKKYDQKPFHSKYKILNDCLKEFINFINNHHQKVHFSLHPSIQDIRQFQFSNNDKNKYFIDIKYTSLLDIENIKNIDDIIKNSRKSRSQDYNKAMKKFVFDQSNNIEAINELHKKTFERQNERRGPGGDLMFEKIIKVLNKNNNISIFSCEDKNKIISASIFIEYKDYAYYLIGANDPEYRNSGAGTAVIFEHIKHLLNNKIKMIDFLGINSPLRGDFKTSFNSKIQPYFEISYNND